MSNDHSTTAPYQTSSIVDSITDSLMPIRRAALSLGSNVGDRFDYLQQAVHSLLASPELHPFAVSPVYETKPVGGPDQPDFYNAVLVVDTTLTPEALLERAHAVEEALGRDRSKEERHGPRTLDIDLLAVGSTVIDKENLKLPHPRAHERAFVLAPWADVDPNFVIPTKASVAELLEQVGRDGVRRVMELRLELN